MGFNSGFKGLTVWCTELALPLVNSTYETPCRLMVQKDNLKKLLKLWFTDKQAIALHFKPVNSVQPVYASMFFIRRRVYPYIILKMT